MGYWIANAVDADDVPISIFIEGACIARIVRGESVDVDNDGIDAQGWLLAPGLIDVHTHMRDPGYTHKEDVRSGAQAAARGGFTTIACMPNTQPPLDDVAVLHALQERIDREACVRVLPYACMTRGSHGVQLTDFAALRRAGAFAFTDDGVGVQSAARMFEAMQRAAMLGVSIVAHCEDESLAMPKERAITQGAYAQKHGHVGIPNVSEAVHVARDVLLAEATGVHYHVCHVSTAQSVDVIRQAKARGVRVSAEVCPHHLLLCEDDIPDVWDNNWKMNPPLRSRADVDALIAGVTDGTIDCFATDHAPHTEAEKARSMIDSPFGIVGLETAFPLLYTHFVRTGIWTLPFLLARWTRVPAALFDLPFGVLEEGCFADVALIDTRETRTIDPQTFASKGRNTPFSGWACQGWPVATIVGGRVVWARDGGVRGGER